MTTTCAEASTQRLIFQVAGQSLPAAAPANVMKQIYTSREAHQALRGAESDRACLIEVQLILTDAVKGMRTLASELDLMMGTWLETEAARVQQALDAVTKILDG